VKLPFPKPTLSNPERLASPRPLLLVGFMGAGKTSVGHALALRLGWRFIDLDRCIEDASGHTIADLFAHAGEQEFRRLERDTLSTALQQLPPQAPAVIALGGGAFVQRGVPGLARGFGAVSVFLDAEPDELWTRCSAHAGARPLALEENQFRQLYAARRPRYMEADMCVSTSRRTVEQVVDELCLRLGHITPGGEM
jgi:shikimate kinase